LPAILRNVDSSLIVAVREPSGSTSTLMGGRGTKRRDAANEATCPGVGWRLNSGIGTGPTGCETCVTEVPAVKALGSGCLRRRWFGSDGKAASLVVTAPGPVPMVITLASLSSKPWKPSESATVRLQPGAWELPLKQSTEGSPVPG